MAKEQRTTKEKILIVNLAQAVNNIGISGMKTLSIKNTPGLELELYGDSAVKYKLTNKTGTHSGIIFHPQSVVFE